MKFTGPFEVTFVCTPITEGENVGCVRVEFQDTTLKIKFATAFKAADADAIAGALEAAAREARTYKAALRGGGK